MRFIADGLAGISGVARRNETNLCVVGGNGVKGGPLVVGSAFFVGDVFVRVGRRTFGRVYRR